MYGIATLVEHDLNLTFDRRGRLWKFRPAQSRHGRQPVDARMTAGAIAITVTVPGLQSGEVDLSAEGKVLKIRGKADRTMDLACDVQLPRTVDLEVLETICAHDVLEIRVPLVAPVKAEPTQAEPATQTLAVAV
jgi:HSP20 family molecular chaperone IbpA